MIHQWWRATDFRTQKSWTFLKFCIFIPFQDENGHILRPCGQIKKNWKFLTTRPFHICAVSNWPMNHHVHFVVLMKIPTSSTALTSEMFVILLQNRSLPPLSKTNKIATNPVWLISFINQTDLVTNWCKIKIVISGECEYHGRLAPIFWQIRWLLLCPPLKTTTRP